MATTRIMPWAYGTNRTVPADNDRIALIAITIEETTSIEFSNLTWGGVPVNTLHEEYIVSDRNNLIYLGYLDESEIQSMSGGAITSDGDPLDSVLTSAYDEVDQVILTLDECSNSTTSSGTVLDCSAAISATANQVCIQLNTSSSDVALSSVTSGFTNQITDGRNGQAASVAEKPVGAAFSGTPTVTWASAGSRRGIYAVVLKDLGEPLTIDAIDHAGHGVAVANVAPIYKSYQVDGWLLGNARIPTIDAIAYKNMVGVVTIFEKRLLAGGSITTVSWGGQTASELYNQSLTDATYRYILYCGLLNNTQMLAMVGGDILVDAAPPTGEVYTATFCSVNQVDFFEGQCGNESQAFGGLISCPAAIKSADDTHMIQFGLDDLGSSIFSIPVGFVVQVEATDNAYGQSIAQIEPLT